MEIRGRRSDSDKAYQKEHSLLTEVAGIAVRLNFHDAGLFNKLQPFLGHNKSAIPRSGTGRQLAPPRRGRQSAVAKGYGGTWSAMPAFTLEVQPAESAEFDPGDSAEILDGCGEYEGMIDVDKGCGFVILTGTSHVAAFANCLRHLCTRLIMADNGLVMHAACIVSGSRAFIFAGPSGAGKSTVCRLSPDRLILSDDLTAVRKLDGRFLAWGMPAARSTKHDSRDSRHAIRDTIHETRDTFGHFEIGAVFALVKDTENRLVPLSKAKALARVLAMPPASVHSPGTGKILELLVELTDHVPCYELHFRKDPSFWENIEKALNVQCRTSNIE